VNGLKKSDLQKVYEERFPKLEQAAKELEKRIKTCLEDVPRIDLICARAKSIESFVQKATRKPERYTDPLKDIQDQIGVRIVVFYLDDVQYVTEKVLGQFRHIEDQVIEQPEPERFGYEARHLICLLPIDILEEYELPIEFFELQVCTLFQHAWAQANHDLGYKAKEEIAEEERKLMAWAAAQAWGADRIFNELWRMRRGNDTLG